MAICFSATASFGLGAVLLGVGALSLRRSTSMREVPYAAIPALFGAHQSIEGGLWLSLPAHLPAADTLTVIYLLVSNVLWPIYVPLAIWLIEPSAAHRKRLIFPVAAGAAVSIFFLAAILANPVSAAISGLHIDYNLPHPHDKIAFAFYAVATCLAPLLSSNKMVRLFGSALIVSMIVAYAIYSMWFASVWCFFAAFLSVLVLLHFRRRNAVHPEFSLHL